MMDLPKIASGEHADIESSSDDYAARFAGAAGAWMLGVQEKIVLHLLKQRAGASILDVGGGHGQLALPLASEGFKVTVLGSDGVCINRIETEVNAGRMQFVVGDLAALPFPDRSFDVVVSIRLLPHCDAWPTLIAELCRVAKRAVIVDYPTGQSINCFSLALFSVKKKIEKNTRPFTLFRHRVVAEEFARHGFKVVKRKGEFFLPMVLHRMLKCPALSAIMEGICGVLGLKRLLGSPVLVWFERAEKRS